MSRTRLWRGRFGSNGERKSWMRPPDLHVRASEMARRLNHPAAYDAHYLALAEMYTCPFWTADERLFNAVHEALNWVHWLGDYRH